MTLTDALQKKLSELPAPVQDYLYSEKAGELNEEIISRNGIGEDQEASLFAFLRELFLGEVPLGTLQAETQKRFGLDADKARKLAADIAGYRLLPLDKWLGDVSGTLRALGADPSAYPTFRVAIEHRTSEEAAEEVVQSIAAVSAEPRVQDRLQNVVESFLAGVRTEEQTKEVLMRPSKIGGLEMPKEEAERVLSELREEVRSVVIDEGLAESAEETPPSEPGPSSARPKDDFVTITKEDEKEIEKIKREVLPAKGVEAADRTADKIQASVEAIYAASGLKTDDEAMAKRIKTVIGNRLRDVRDQMETLETMAQPKELGGLGLGQEAARKLLNAIQDSLKRVHEAHAAQMQAEKAQWVEKEQGVKQAVAADATASQQTDLEKLYQSIVSKTGKAPAAPAAPAAMPAPPAPAAIPPNLPVTDANPVPPELRAPTVVPLPKPEPAIATMQAPKPMSIVRPMPGAPAPAPAVGPAGERIKPRVEDIKGAPRLTGPVEELRAITIVDFRRLSKDPKEACLKIKDKIDLLADQSYTRRSQGIAAWTASEVVRTYLEQMREGLNGLPLKDAIAARQAGKKPYITPEEFQAVAELSRQLRY